MTSKTSPGTKIWYSRKASTLLFGSSSKIPWKISIDALGVGGNYLFAASSRDLLEELISRKPAPIPEKPALVSLLVRQPTEPLCSQEVSQTDEEVQVLIELTKGGRLESSSTWLGFFLNLLLFQTESGAEGLRLDLIPDAEIARGLFGPEVMVLRRVEMGWSARGGIARTANER